MPQPEIVEIPLTRGYVALVDAEDAEEILKYKWHVMDYRRMYATRSVRENGKTGAVRMHRMIMNAPDGVDVDHINHNGLDNRKTNLRICNRTQNLANMRRRRNAQNIYRGTCYDKRLNKWNAQISAYGKSHYLGSFKTPQAAALRYNEAAKHYFGEFAQLNDVPQEACGEQTA